MKRAQRRRAAGAAGAVLLVAAIAAAIVSAPVGAAGETLAVTPNTNLTDGQTVSVTVTTTAATTAGVFIAVTQCGNADSSGAPLAAVTADDCVGAGGLGTSLQLIDFPAGNVPAGDHTVSLTMKQTGIGANQAQCIPSPPATLPCVVQAATATVAGAYTGPDYNFATSATIAYTAPVTTTTTAPATTSTTAPATTTTTAPATTAPPTTKTFTCTDIPLATSALVVSPNRCLTDGQVVTISAAPGSVVSAADVTAQASAFVLQCNPDATIPADGSGCNVGGLVFAPIGADGSIAPTQVTVKTGQIGTSPLSVCPPSQAQADAGAVTCIIAAASGPADPSPLAAGITFDGESVVLPVDSSGNPTTPPPGGSTTAGGGGVTISANTTTQAATLAARPLAFTGVTATTWWLVAIAIALVDLGYLVISSTWTRKVRRVYRRS
jgi:hypothetical protein